MRTSFPFWAIAATCAMAVPLPGQAAEWSQHQGNAAHNGYAPVSLDPGQFRLRWSKRLTIDRELGHPVAADGLVVVQRSSGTGQGVYSYDHVTGELLWSDAFPGLAPSRINDPALHDGGVVVHANEAGIWGEFYFIDGRLGNRYVETWTQSANVEYWAPAIFGQAAYLPSGRYGGVAAREIATGNVQWEYDLNQADAAWTPAVDDDRVYFYQDGKLHGFDRLSGAVDFLVPDPNWTSNRHDYPTPMLGGLDNVITGENNRITNWDRNTGIHLWEVSGTFTEPSAVHAGVIYARGYDGRVVALSETDGSFLWEWYPPNADQILGKVIVTDSHLIASSLTTTYVVDLTTRTVDWSYPDGGKLALGQSNLVIGGWQGTLSVIAYREVPEPADVGPDRVEYYAGSMPTVTITGQNFDDAAHLEVWFGDEQADNVVLVDSSTITCTPPQRDPGVVDVEVRNSHGYGVIDGGFAYTPCQTLNGDFVLGGRVDLRLDFTVGDGIAVLYDFGAARTQPLTVPPYIGEFWLESYSFLFETASWPFDDHLALQFDIPNDPALQGQMVQVQSAIGADPRGKVAAFTNLSSFVIQ